MRQNWIENYFSFLLCEAFKNVKLWKEFTKSQNLFEVVGALRTGWRQLHEQVDKSTKKVERGESVKKDDEDKNSSEALVALITSPTNQ